MAGLRVLREEVRARNLDLSDEEADAIADEAGREAIARVVTRLRRDASEQPA
jgi:hypothetical protein